MPFQAPMRSDWKPNKRSRVGETNTSIQAEIFLRFNYNIFILISSHLLGLRGLGFGACGVLYIDIPVEG